MSLPEIDIAYLGERGIAHEIVVESGMTCIVMSQWPLPRGFDHDESDLLVRLSPGYPDVPPDMWWFSPPVRLANGWELSNTNVVETYLGAVGSAGRDTSAAGSGNPASMGLRASSP